MTDDTIRGWTIYARWLAGRYWAPGLERDDIVQEALIGLLSADRDYRPGTGSFDTFAKLCMQRNVIEAVRSGRRTKRRLLNDAGRVGRDDDGNVFPLVELAADRQADPVEIIATRQRLRAIVAAAADLTLLERESVIGIAVGRSYVEIAGRTGFTIKQIDNASRRARQKLREAA